MIMEDLVELQFDSLHRLELTWQHLVILRDPQTRHGLPIPLTTTEADALEVAFRARQYGNELPFPQDTSQRLLESLGGQLQRVVINALAGQTLYATVTITQGAQTHEVRTAFLLNPHGRVSACKGPDTQEALQRYSDSRNDLSGPTSLTNEHELRRQLGHQPQNISAVPYIEKKAIRQEQREEISARRIDAGRMVLTGGRNLPSGWRLVVFADRDMKEERRQHIHQAWRELRDILTQRASD